MRSISPNKCQTEFYNSDKEKTININFSEIEKKSNLLDDGKISHGLKSVSNNDQNEKG